MIPIILPVGHVAPSRCPNCHRGENVKSVCRNCAYEYPDDNFSVFWFVVGIIAIAMGAVWFLFTIMEWAMPLIGHPTLVEVLQYQAQWLWALAHRIW